MWKHLTDPSPISSAARAIGWIEGAALGNVATAVMTIAVAVVGMLMLSGHWRVRRGLAAVFGAFLIFGAPSIAAGLIGIEGTVKPRASATATSDSPFYRPSVPAPQPYDPYAGASVPH